MPHVLPGGETLAGLPDTPSICKVGVAIGVNITAFGRKLTLFSTIPLSRLSLKMSRFFVCAYFELAKMHSMRSFQRQVELRRLGNQLPVLGKGNSLFQLVKCCVCLPVLRAREIFFPEEFRPSHYLVW